jgi:glucokinase
LKRVLGLDLGGTYVKAVVVDVAEDGGTPRVVHTDVEPTGADRGPEAVTETMVALGNRIVGEAGPVEGAGVGVPGLFDFRTGEVVFFTNLPGRWEGFPLRSRIAAGLGVPATLINDARAFTLAEGTVGAGRGCRTFVCITLGTGVGGGVMIDGKLHFGAFGTGGEIGHQTVAPDGPVCGCGNPGCMEAVTRPPKIVADAGRETMEQVLDGVADGDPRCRDALADAVGYLAIGLGNMMTVLGPERIVIGGGVAEAGEALLGPIREAVRSRVTLVPPERVEVVAAELGAMAGAVGAALASLGSAYGDEEFLHGEIPSAAIRRGEDQA